MYTHIAIDGPAGAGKSTIAKAVARTLQIPYLDTGAMYRALGLYALRCGVDPRDGEGVAAILPEADVRAVHENGVQRMFVNGEDVTGFIRTPEISKAASDIGVHPAVREKLVEIQQAFAESASVVMDGRDICKVVLPFAKHKFFITASPRVRAERRVLEMRQKGEAPPTLEEMEQSIRDRDHTDSTRACNPLTQAEDALIIDTSDMTIEQSVEAVLRAIREK